MLYKFKSTATSDLVMLEAHGQQLMQALGRDPCHSPAQGILQPNDMPAALRALEEAITRDEAHRRAAQTDADATDDDTDQTRAQSLGLRQRFAPFIVMVQRSLAADAPIVWGV